MSALSSACHRKPDAIRLVKSASTTVSSLLRCCVERSRKRYPHHQARLQAAPMTTLTQLVAEPAGLWLDLAVLPRASGSESAWRSQRYRRPQPVRVFLADDHLSNSDHRYFSSNRYPRPRDGDDIPLFFDPVSERIAQREDVLCDIRFLDEDAAAPLLTDRLWKPLFPIFPPARTGCRSPAEGRTGSFSRRSWRRSRSIRKGPNS